MTARQPSGGEPGALLKPRDAVTDGARGWPHSNRTPVAPGFFFRRRLGCSPSSGLSFVLDSAASGPSFPGTVRDDREPGGSQQPEGA